MHASQSIDFSGVEALTFDCYGTLIDWETGLLATLHHVLGDRVATEGPAMLEEYARAETALEAGPYRSYRSVLAEALSRVCRARGIEPRESERERFATSIGDWPPFPDSAAALRRLHERYRLGVITNCDDELFALSAERLGISFDWVVTAQQARSYKPERRIFELALGRIGLPRSRLVHVAQSLYHDHVPAAALGIRSVWIDRRRGRPGFGATPPGEAQPSLTLIDLHSLAELALA